ncbi:MAG TPA: flagellar protein FlaG [Chromatiales bacterium]|nr:flagellar protein FlaG [Chromatiales bacterium]
MDSLDTIKLQTLPAAASPTPATHPAADPAGKNPPPTGKNVPAAANREPAPVEKIDLSGVMKQIESYLSSSRRSLNFRVDEASGEPVITVINPENGEVIRQIPSEEALRMAAAIDTGDARLIDTLV